MKIIAVGMNYAQHNQELGHTQVNEAGLCHFKGRQAVFHSRLF